MNTPLSAQRLSGKVALVTGIGSGIGQGCARMFARQGARVMSCDIDTGAAEAAVAQARRDGLEIESMHPCDLTQPADVTALVDRTVERFGGLDILVNAAAWGAFAPVESMDFHAEWRRTLSGELDVVFLACQAAWPSGWNSAIAISLGGPR